MTVALQRARSVRHQWKSTARHKPTGGGRSRQPGGPGPKLSETSLRQQLTAVDKLMDQLAELRYTPSTLENLRGAMADEGEGAGPPGRGSQLGVGAGDHSDRAGLADQRVYLTKLGVRWLSRKQQRLNEIEELLDEMRSTVAELLAGVKAVRSELVGVGRAASKPVG